MTDDPGGPLPPPSTRTGRPPPLVDGAAPRPALDERFIARWDLDKTYLRTDFDTLRDLVRTAIERPDQKRTVPGAAALLRELGRAGVETHILSGSPEQLRSRIEEKLRLDGARWSSLTLKPNLQNMLRLRFRALRGQLGYKLPALLLRRAELVGQRLGTSDGLVREVLLGDDAEADAFVYSLYGDVCRGAVDEALLTAILRKGGAYDDSIRDAIRFARYIERGAVVERILIHLERQSAPSDFKVYGGVVVPFYNYLQAAFVLHEDRRLGARAVLNVATDLCVAHNFEAGALSRSYLDLMRRGHLDGSGIGDLEAGLSALLAERRASAASALTVMVEALRALRKTAPPKPSPSSASVSATAPKGPTIDYLALVGQHNPRRSKRH